MVEKSKNLMNFLTNQITVDKKNVKACSDCKNSELVVGSIEFKLDNPLPSKNIKR